MNKSEEYRTPTFEQLESRQLLVADMTGWSFLDCTHEQIDDGQISQLTQIADHRSTTGRALDARPPGREGYNRAGDLRSHDRLATSAPSESLSSSPTSARHAEVVPSSTIIEVILRGPSNLMSQSSNPARTTQETSQSSELTSSPFQTLRLALVAAQARGPASATITAATVGVDAEENVSPTSRGPAGAFPIVPVSGETAAWSMRTVELNSANNFELLNNTQLNNTQLNNTQPSILGSDAAEIAVDEAMIDDFFWPLLQPLSQWNSEANTPLSESWRLSPDLLDQLDEASRVPRNLERQSDSLADNGLNIPGGLIELQAAGAVSLHSNASEGLVHVGLDVTLSLHRSLDLISSTTAPTQVPASVREAVLEALLNKPVGEPISKQTTSLRLTTAECVGVGVVAATLTAAMHRQKRTRDLQKPAPAKS